MLEHAGEALLLFVGLWRFLLSGGYRRRKLEEWRAARRTAGGIAMIAVEIAAAVAFGLVLPVGVIAVVALGR